jgi:hypothetical protein
MNFTKFILIIFTSVIICQREQFQIVNIGNPNFRPEETENLVFGFNHMTSGASSPCYGLNELYTDIFGQKWDGYCELTKKGFLQLFKLGKIYQERFNRLLNLSNPDINKVRSFASQANKTLMSSNAFFYGMFINKDIPIDEQLTVPVRNFKSYNKSELIPIFYYTESSHCKGWKKMIEENMNKRSKAINTRFHSFIKRYRNVFDLVKNDERMINSKTLYDKVNLFCSSYISNYYDDRCPKIPLFKTLKYTQQQFFDLYYDCIEINLFRHVNVEYGWEARKVPMIVLSELVKDMLSYMDAIIKNPESPRYVSFIGHDTSMAGLQIILEKAFNVPPKMMNYASNQLFLLYKIGDNNNQIDINNQNDVDKNYNVKYFFNDQLSMVERYDEFKKGILDAMKTENDLEYFCNGLNSYDFVVLILCSGIIFLLIAIVSFCCYHGNEIFSKKVYMSLKEEPKEKSVEIRN